MGIIDKLRRVGGIAKNRLASAVGALRGAVGGVTVSGARVSRGVRFAARGTRLLTPAGLGLTAISFAPEIAKLVRGAGRAVRALPKVVGRGIAFFGGRQVVTAGGAGLVAGALTRRKSGEVTRPSDLQTVAPRADVRRAERIDPRTGRRVARKRKKKRKAVTRRRIPKHRHRVISVPVRRRKKTKRRTHKSPRHKGHKRVSFTTADGKKVSFLANPKARHR